MRTDSTAHLAGRLRHQAEHHATRWRDPCPVTREELEAAADRLQELQKRVDEIVRSEPEDKQGSPSC